MACISIPSVPLQILLNRHPEWRQTAVAVVSEDKPLGRITEVNTRAYESGVRPGMRYATALTIQPMLRAGTVDTLDVGNLEQEIHEICELFSPICESAVFATGVFWIDAAGMEHLFETEYVWARALCAAIRERGYSVRCAVGATRRGTFCNAVSTRGITLFRTEAEELECMRELRLDVLPFDALMLLRLHHLGIDTIGSFIALPAAEIRSRFGESSFSIHLFLSRGDQLPLQPKHSDVACSTEKKFQEGVAGIEALLAVTDPMFDSIAAIARRRGMYFNRIVLTLFDEEDRERIEELLPAEPTRSKHTMLRLLRIRLESVQLSARLETAVYRCILSGDPVPRSATQQVLIGSSKDRDGKAAAEAFAVIRAELGNDAIQIPVLQEYHDPQKRVEWKVLLPGSSVKATPVESDFFSRDDTPVLCRRFLPTPRPYSQMRDTIIAGPYRIDGEWWDSEPGRVYRFTRTPAKEIYWSFQADSSKVGYVQGWVG
jgi:protein ImuB